MKRFCILLLISYACLCSRAGITGEMEPIPYTPYMYQHQEATGMSMYSMDNPVIWTVVNGKIMDDEGDFTLTSKIIYTSNEDIYVQWDGLMDEESTGRLTFSYSDGFLYQFTEVRIKPANLLIQDQTIDKTQSYASPYITIENTKMTNAASAQINGYHSVRLLPGTTIAAGANVRIYNEEPSLPAYYLRESPDLMRMATRNTRHLEQTVALLEQNAPNPATNTTAIRYFIPEGVQSALLCFFDTEGKAIKKVAITQTGNGTFFVGWPDFAPGTYIYSLVIDGKLAGSKQMVLK